MNRQIDELTSMVRALTEKVTNGREENGQNVRNIEILRRRYVLTVILQLPITCA